MTMNHFERVNDVLSRANRAIKSGSRSEAIIALKEAKPILAAHIAEGSSFSAQVTMQATLMSLLAGELPLAQEFAAMVMAEVADYLEKLCGIYKRKLEEGKPKEARDMLLVANLFVLAFVPYVQRHPRISMEQVDLVQDEASGIAFILHHVRPKLDSAGWSYWPYPQAVIEKVKYWSARALIDFSRMLLDTVSSGHDIQDAQGLIEKGFELLQGRPPDQLAADAYNALGRVFMSYGDYELIQNNAIPCFEKSIAILDAIGNTDDAAVDRGNLGAIYITLARFADANGEIAKAAEAYRKAEEHLRAALEVHRTTSGVFDHLLGDLSNLGALYLYSEQQREDEAYAVFAEAWDRVCKAGEEELPVGVTILVNLGNSLRMQNKLVEAERRLRQAVAAIEKPGAPHPEPRVYLLAYGGLGDVLRRQQQCSEAYAFLVKALERLESYRSSFVSERSNMALLKSFRWVYEATIDCCATLSLSTEQPERGAEAFNLAEKIKWRALTTLLRFQYLRLPDPHPEHLMAEEEHLLKQIADIVLGSPIQATGTVDVAAALRRLEEIWTEIEHRHPDYVAIRRQKTIEAQDVSVLLDDQVPVLVEYYLGDEFNTALAFVLHKGSTRPQVVRLGASPQDLRTQVQELRAQDETQPPLEAFKKISNRLYHELIEPVLPFILEGVGVCIVPYGALHNIPFGALYDGQRYLIERNPIVIAPSATALRWWVKKNRPSPRRCLIFTATSGIRTARGELPDLDMFEELAQKQIAPLFTEARIVKPEEATKQSLCRELARQEHYSPWDVIHLACHGVFSPENALLSRLVMGGDPTDQTKDLAALEIFVGVRPDATLVTLSACETGIAYAATGDEMFGLAHAFLFGGASSVLSSLWYARQDVGVTVTRRFYELWTGRGKNERPHSKIEALQIAQQEALQKREWFGLVKPWSHPYLWAAFQLYGDWR